MVIKKLQNNLFSVHDGIRYPRVDQGFIYLFIIIFQFCDVATMVIVHKRK